MPRILLIVFAWMIVLPGAAYADKLKVAASFSILGDMVHEVAGDNIELTTLVGPNGDAHVYEPSPADAKALTKADLVIVNGLAFEGWLGRLIVSSGYTGPIIAASQGVQTLEFGEKGILVDPHAWQSLPNAKIYVANIRDALVNADSPHAAQYRANAANYLKKIEELDQWIRSEIAKVPEDRRRVITSHDAFQYFAKAYGVAFIAPLGVSTGTEASAADIAKLIDQLRREKTRVIFMENITDPRLIKQLASDAHATLGGTLYSDALSDINGPAPTYLAMFKYNATVLIQGMTYD